MQRTTGLVQTLAIRAPELHPSGNFTTDHLTKTRAALYKKQPSPQTSRRQFNNCENTLPLNDVPQGRDEIRVTTKA